MEGKLGYRLIILKLSLSEHKLSKTLSPSIEDDYGDDDDYDAYDEEYEEQEETESIKKATASKPKATAAAAAAPQPKKEKAKKQVTPSKEEVIKVADPFENKKRQEELRRLADLENTKDLFGVVSDPSGKSDSIANESSGLFSSKPRDFDDEDAVSIDQVGGPSSSQTAASVPSSSDAFITFKPKTAAEFTQFAESISKQIFAATVRESSFPSIDLTFRLTQTKHRMEPKRHSLLNSSKS